MMRSNLVKSMIELVAHQYPDLSSSKKSALVDRLCLIELKHLEYQAAADRRRDENETLHETFAALREQLQYFARGAELLPAGSPEKNTLTGLTRAMEVLPAIADTIRSINKKAEPAIKIPDAKKHPTLRQAPAGIIDNDENVRH